eukprot:2049907-Rhodomonas_salina.4
MLAGMVHHPPFTSMVLRTQCTGCSTEASVTWGHTGSRGVQVGELKKIFPWLQAASDAMVLRAPPYLLRAPRYCTRGTAAVCPAVLKFVPQRGTDSGVCTVGGMVVLKEEAGCRGPAPPRGPPRSSCAPHARTTTPMADGQIK